MSRPKTMVNLSRPRFWTHCGFQLAPRQPRRDRILTAPVMRPVPIVQHLQRRQPTSARLLRAPRPEDRLRHLLVDSHMQPISHLGICSQINPVL